MKAALLVNPRAGSYREGKLNRLVAILEKIGVAVLWHRLEKGQSASEIVSELDHRMTPLIILAAGDGTINTALNALLQRNDYSQFNVAIVPIGTANVLSMELGVDSIEKSLKAIVGGKIKKLHMGRIIAIPEDRDNSRYFMLMASAGLDSKAVSGVNEELKKKIGGFAYLYEFFKILLKKNFRQLKVSVDSQLYEGVMVCVANGKYYGIKLPIASAKIDKNCFDVIIVKKISIMSMIMYFFTKNDNRNIIKLTNKNQVIIESINDNYPLQVDGDYCCNLPVKIESNDSYINVYHL